jgi:hypothetical protein
VAIDLAQAPAARGANTGSARSAAHFSCKRENRARRFLISGTGSNEMQRGCGAQPSSSG